MADGGATGQDAEDRARRAADRLALALEESGFDVGRAFPLLIGAVDRDGAPMVELGRVTDEVASELADVLTRAARGGLDPAR